MYCITVHNKMSNLLKSQSLLKRASTLPVLKNKFVLPDRFKGTFVEKWAHYWKSLFADYKSMVVDLKTEIQDKPTKAICISSGLVLLWQMMNNNPDENDFKENIRRYSNQLLLVGDACRNIKTVEHFKLVEKSFNENTLRRLNLGIASFLWLDDYDKNCDIYKAKCEYTKPGYFSIPSRIIDVGVFGRWWNIYIKFQDFDNNL